MEHADNVYIAEWNGTHFTIGINKSWCWLHEEKKNFVQILMQINHKQKPIYNKALLTLFIQERKERRKKNTTNIATELKILNTMLRDESNNNKKKVEDEGKKKSFQWKRK